MFKARLHRPVEKLLLALGLGVGLLGCDDSTGPEEDARLTLSVVVSAAEAGVSGDEAGAFPTSLLQDDGVHSLVITRVAVVVREIELKRMSDDDCDDLLGEEHAACEAFEAGPLLLELPLDGSVHQISVAEVAPDVYDEIEIDVHKPEDDGIEDVQFLLQHPDFKDVSIRVEGTFDGDDFVFFQDLNEERELDLVPPLEVEKGFESVNLTLELDVGSWFRTSGLSLLDPRTGNKGGPNEELVEENIRASIRAFADSDKDGRRD